MLGTTDPATLCLLRIVLTMLAVVLGAVALLALRALLTPRYPAPVAMFGRAPLLYGVP